MPYAVYKLIHLAGIFLLVMALAMVAMNALRGGTRADDPYRRALLATHGVGAFLVLLGGFGMLARLGVAHGGLPGWIYLKLGIWGLLAAAIGVVYRGKALARGTLLALPLLALLAAVIAMYKPL